MRAAVRALGILGCLILLLGWIAWSEDEPSGPERIEIRELSHWFGPVRFAHGDHALIAGDCESCHHHSDGEAVTCATCHEVGGDLDAPELPSLKVAYHENCMGCHREVEAGPLACESCHQRRALPLGAPLPDE